MDGSGGLRTVRRKRVSGRAVVTFRSELFSGRGLSGCFSLLSSLVFLKELVFLCCLELPR